MTTYAAFLRSINVGKHNRIRMEELRALLAGIGLEEPRTYLQSGNVTFRSDRDEDSMTLAIEEALEGRGLKGASVMVRSLNELKKLDGESFRGYDSGEFVQCVAFLRKRVQLDLLPFPLKKATVVGGDDRTLLSVISRVDGMQAQPSAAIESRWKTQATFRFWNVVQDFIKVCENGVASA